LTTLTVTTPTTSHLFFSRSIHPPAPHSFPTRRSSDLLPPGERGQNDHGLTWHACRQAAQRLRYPGAEAPGIGRALPGGSPAPHGDRKSTRLNSSHEWISYAVFCLKKKNKKHNRKRSVT